MVSILNIKTPTYLVFNATEKLWKTNDGGDFLQLGDDLKHIYITTSRVKYLIDYFKMVPEALQPKEFMERLDELKQYTK